MANMQPLRREDHPELEELFRLYDDTMSFVPNSLFTMARRPEILRAFSELITQIWRTGTVPVGLKPLVAIVASTAAGCRYCQAHETVDARMRGVDEAKIADVWDFERSPRYSEAERAALRFARDASVVPNAVKPAHFEDLRQVLGRRRDRRDPRGRRSLRVPEPLERLDGHRPRGDPHLVRRPDDRRARMGAGEARMTFGERITLEELERDPYPIYARLREEEPVAWVPAVQLWLVTRYDDVRTVDLSPEVFTAATDPSTLNRTMGVNMLGSEGPDQQRIRRVVEPPFRPRDVEERTTGMIPALANELIDGFEGRGEVDLFTEFADPMSVRSLRFMLGLDEVAWEDLLRWNQGLMLGLANFEGDPAKQAPADEASASLSDVIERVLDRLEDEPDGSVLSAMLHHDEAGDRMTREEIVANTKLMLSGGLQEPRDVIALVIYALGSNPSQLEEVRSNPRLVKAAVEETLRWAGPVGTSTRQTTETTELAGVELEEGALIGAVLSSANRDPRRFTDPDRFDVHRKEGAHLAFAVGNHFCLGAWFGRHLARVSLEILLERLPGLRLDPERPATLNGWEFRAPDSTCVRWDVP